MISYEPFFAYIKEHGISQYALVHKFSIPNGTVYRMRKNKPISSVTLNLICKKLKCKVEDIVVYKEDELE